MPPPTELQNSAFRWAGPTGLPYPTYPGEMVSHLVRLYGQNGEPGPVVANPTLDGVRAFMLGLADTSSASPGRVTIAANGQAQAVMRAPAAQNIRGDLEIFTFLGEFSQRFLARAYCSSMDVLLMNSPIPAACLFGTGQFPAVLAQTLWAEALSTIQWDLFDVSGSTNEVCLQADARQFHNYDIPGLDRESLVEAFQQRGEHLYYLTWNRPESNTGGITLAANELLESGDLQMTVPGDGDFICFGVMDDSDGPYELKFASGAAGALHMSEFVPISLFAGTTSAGLAGERRAASNPKWWWQPHRFARQTEIHFRIRNLSNVANVVRLVFFGLKSKAPELGKQTIRLLDQGYMPRPLATAGSGNWQGIDPGSRGSLLRPGIPQPLYNPYWEGPGR